jgi:hypothetical protein
VSDRCPITAPGLVDSGELHVGEPSSVMSVRAQAAVEMWEEDASWNIDAYSAEDEI